MKLPILLFWCGVAYAVLLVFVRGILPPESSPTVSLIGIPLIVIATIIALDLSGRLTRPTVSRNIPSRSLLSEDPVKFSSDQIRVAARSSDSYFENMIRTRLKELLITKVALERDMDSDETRRVLSDPLQRMRILDDELCTVLYGPLPSRRDRTRMIGKAVDLIGAWKG
jgi:hypothetical protein